MTQLSLRGRGGYRSASAHYHDELSDIEHLPITSRTRSVRHHNVHSEGKFPMTQLSLRGRGGYRSASTHYHDELSDIEHLPITSRTRSVRHHNVHSEGNFPMTQLSMRGRGGYQSASADYRDELSDIEHLPITSRCVRHHNVHDEGKFPVTQLSVRGRAGSQSASADYRDEHSYRGHLPITSRTRRSVRHHSVHGEGKFPITQLSVRGRAGSQSASADYRDEHNDIENLPITSRSVRHHNVHGEGKFPITQLSVRGRAGSQSVSADYRDEHSYREHLPITSRTRRSVRHHSVHGEGKFPITQLSVRGRAGSQSASADYRDEHNDIENLPITSRSVRHHNLHSEGNFSMTQLSMRGRAGSQSASADDSDEHNDIEQLPITSGSVRHHNQHGEGTAGVASGIHEGRQRWYLWIVSYPSFVLLLMLLAYLLSQLDGYMLANTSKPMAREVHFGDKACDVNTSLPANVTEKAVCSASTAASCLQSDLCIWDYNGQGMEYQMVAGPIFILTYTFVGLFISFFADLFNRRNLLVACLILWSTATILTGLVEEYWQLVILRFLFGFSEAGCTPLAVSILTDYFPSHMQGLVVGIYSLGVYTGYSMSYASGNLITLTDIMGQGWRWSFYISGIPGVVLGVIILLTVSEPARSTSAAFLKPSATYSVILLFLGASVSNGAGYVWAYNTQTFFKTVGQTPDQITTYMSWVPLVGGSIGVILGGQISDFFMRRVGVIARVYVLTFSQLVAALFATATLYSSAPTCYIMQIPTYIIGEMWVGVALAVLVELVDSESKTLVIAVYLLIITNIGCNVPLMVPPIQAAFEKDGLLEADALRNALYILYPGLYAGGWILFLLIVSLWRDK